MSIELTREHGYIFLTVFEHALLLIWMSSRVISARKKYHVDYPNLYSTKPETPDGKMFNCIQRVHQQTLEGFTGYMVFLLLSAIKYPVFAAVCGNVWILGRIVYALGYYSGNPKKRFRGEFFFLAEAGLLGCTVYTALQLLGVM